jgi:hypothetical protein
LTQINVLRPRGRQARNRIVRWSLPTVRASRRWLAALMILGFASAQFISLARACTLASDAANAPAVGTWASMPADCPMQSHGAPSHASCDTHGVPHAQADKTADARIPLAPPNAIVLRVNSPSRHGDALVAPPLARIASPPPLVLFSRRLI